METKTKSMIYHAADTRGLANHGWLISRHTFSFAGYYNPDRINFGALRVLNDDILKPGMGFGAHPHDNMEIISIPIYGSLAHKDSTGIEKEIRTGEVQIMSAGSGIVHSEYNYSKTQETNFLQIWIFPKVRNIAPRYDQKDFTAALDTGELVTVVSPVYANALWINQDAVLSLGHLKKDSRIKYETQFSGNATYAFLINGSVELNGRSFSNRDAVGILDDHQLEIDVVENSTLLMIEVPRTH